MRFAPQVSLCRMRGAALKLGQMLSIQDESVIPPQVRPVTAHPICPPSITFLLLRRLPACLPASTFSPQLTDIPSASPRIRPDSSYAQIQKALERVRQGADVMPTNQLQQVLSRELGPTWRERLSEFGEEPIAAASIGQVHKARLLDGRLVAMKIQYPGVAESIDSDIDNLMRLVRMTDMLPKARTHADTCDGRATDPRLSPALSQSPHRSGQTGTQALRHCTCAATRDFAQGLFVDQAVRVAKQELALECDYRWELEAQRRFSTLLAGDESFRVPGVVEELCSERVLTTELAPGVPIDKVADMPQEERDRVGTSLLRLILRELFEFRFMQTDPNFANFLYDQPSGRLTLIDFGAAKQCVALCAQRAPACGRGRACVWIRQSRWWGADCSGKLFRRRYPDSFVDDYLHMVGACARKDRATVLDASRRLGFLTVRRPDTFTAAPHLIWEAPLPPASPLPVNLRSLLQGDESKVLLDAHCEAAFVVGMPFAEKGTYDFSKNAMMTSRVGELGQVMLKHRLTAPPENSYSLHRKLSGAFLTCMRIKARVPCHDLFFSEYARRFEGRTSGPIKKLGRPALGIDDAGGAA